MLLHLQLDRLARAWLLVALASYSLGSITVAARGLLFYKRMTKNEFIKLMRYPREWLVWDMLPDELINRQLAEYAHSSEQAAKRYRNAAFHFWLLKTPGKEILLKLIKLSYLDPDPLMSYVLRKEHIAHAENADDEEVAQALRLNRI